MKRLGSIIGWFFAMMMALPVLAASDVDLYSAQVMVKDRSTKSWQYGVKKALDEVLIKVSGNAKINDMPEVIQYHPSLKNLVQSYSYQKKSLYANENQLFLQVRFDAADIQLMLDATHQKVWRKQRPTTLIWLTMPNANGQPEILAKDQHPQYVSILEGAASQRGMPIALPSMDLNDISSISARDVAQMNVPLMNEASRRYSVDGFLLIKVTFNADQYWHAQCRWVEGSAQASWEIQDTSLAGVLASVIDRMTDEMVAHYDSLESDLLNQTSYVRVVGVDGVDDYTKVIDYLKKLAIVTGVELDSIEQHAVMLSVGYRGTEQSLVDAIAHATGNRLVQVDVSLLASDSGVNDPVKLVYRWLEPIAAGVYQNMDIE